LKYKTTASNESKFISFLTLKTAPVSHGGWGIWHLSLSMLNFWGGDFFEAK
jgi:hypothetical protein